MYIKQSKNRLTKERQANWAEAKSPRGVLLINRGSVLQSSACSPAQFETFRLASIGRWETTSFYESYHHVFGRRRRRFFSKRQSEQLKVSLIHSFLSVKESLPSVRGKKSRVLK